MLLLLLLLLLLGFLQCRWLFCCPTMRNVLGTKELKLG